MPYKNKEDRKKWEKENYERIFRERPWFRTYRAINSRISSKFHPSHKYGVKRIITAKELKFLWYRDKAHDMEYPSIDRIDTYGDYTLENCRYIELSENMRRERRKGKTR